MAETRGRWTAVLGRLMLAGLLLSSLSACAMMRNALGITKKPPDEFAIMTKAPLTMPPDFALRPPRPGAEQPQVATPAQRARETIFGLDVNRGHPAPGQSEGEFALLQKAGADDADPNIRQALADDIAAASHKKRGLISRIIWPFGGGSSKPARKAPEGAEQIAPHPTGAVSQDSLPPPGAKSGSPDADAGTANEPPKKKKKGLLRRLIPF